MLKRGFQFAPGYRLQEFLGRGQFGQVWRATAPGGAAAAVKFIDLSGGQGQKEYEGVRRVKQIRHANLMPITAIWLLDGEGKVIEEAPDEAIETIDLSVVEGRGQSALLPIPEVEPSWLVVAMLLGGKSLQHRLRECVQQGLPGIPPKELISYMDESAKGLDFLNAPQHDLGDGPIAIQHSDVKPANIVLIGSSAVVCDFGLARILTRNQVTATSAAGTPAYMAPETIAGKPCRTSDQYSLAVTYYHLRTGTLPVNDGSLWEVLDAHRQGNLKLGLVPAAEQDVLRKATDLNWENRFESNVEMVDAFREALRMEGHTRPGFVPKRVDAAPAALAVGDTAAVKGDPTATLDLAESLPVGESMAATQPFVQSEQPTDQGFVKETLPELEEKPKQTVHSGTFVNSIWRDPKLIAGVGIGAVMIVLLCAIAFHSPNKQANLPAAGDPAELTRAAFALFESDEKAAIEKFAAALGLDPGLELLAPARELSGHEFSVMQMLQTPDAASLVTIADEPAAFLWRLDSNSGTPIKLPGHSGLINCISISPGGGRLLTGGFDEVARVWDLKAADVAGSVIELKGHAAEIKAAAWKNESIVATASADLNMGIWEIGAADDQRPHGTIVRSTQIPIQEMLTAFATDPRGNWLVARTLGGNRVEPEIDLLGFHWDEILNTLTDPGAATSQRFSAKQAEQIAFLTGNRKSLLAVGDSGGGITLYDMDSDELLVEKRNEAHAQVIQAMRVVPVEGGDVLVTGSADGSAQRWMLGTRSQTSARKFCDFGVSCVDVSADGRWVATGTLDGSVWLWDSGAEKDAGAIQFVTGTNSVDSVLIDVASKWLIAGCADGVIRMWDLKHAKLLALTRPTPSEAEFHGPTKTIDTGSVTMR